MKWDENAIIVLSALSRWFWSISTRVSAASPAIRDAASSSRLSNGPGSGTVPPNFLAVNPSALLTRLPRFPMSSAFILDANSSQSKFRSSCEYGFMATR